MAYPEKRQDRAGTTYYRARYWRPDGKLDTVKDENGVVIRYPTKRTAKAAGDAAERDAEVAAKNQKWVAPEAGKTTFRQYVLGQDGTGETDGWLAAQDLAPSTMQNYRRHVDHLLPVFGDLAFDAIDKTTVDAWERREKAEWAASSVKTWRGTLHLILGDAVAAGLKSWNPATKQRGRGRRAGRSRGRGPEKAITNALGMVLVAERAALLTGRDDEFVECVQTGFTGMRGGETTGLEPKYFRDEVIRVEQQLYELDDGQLVLCPPKDDSYRDIDIPPFLVALGRDHLARTSPQPCTCHARRFMFRGRGGAVRTEGAGATLADVARAAGVSTGTVSNVLNRPQAVAQATRERVEKAIADLGYVRGTTRQIEAAHARRNSFRTWIFTPAATGWYPPKAPQPARPVPIVAEPFPGVPARGRGAAARATACWVPIRQGLTRHGLRHTHRTVLEELGTPKVLVDERMGHIDGSVSARYAHVTTAMRQQLMHELTRLWEEALDARLAMCPRSPVPVLDRLLQERATPR